MLRTKLRKVLDPLLALAVIAVLTTGLLIEGAEERGYDLAEVHGGLALLFVVLLAAHIWTNWPMLRANYARKPRRNKTGG